MIRKLLALALLWPAIAWADYRSVVLADGPIGYWRLGESSCVSSPQCVGHDEVGSGANDINYSLTGVTYAQTGALTGDPNTAIKFDGVTGLATVGASGGTANTFRIPAGGSVSFEFWVKETTLHGAAGLEIASKDTGTVNAEWLLGVGGGSPWVMYVQQFDITNTSRAAVATASGIGTSYHYVVFTIQDNTAQKAYFDGTLEGTNTTFAGTQNTSGTANMVLAQLGPAFFPGTIDEFAFYNYVLTQAQITKHYNAGRGIFTGGGWPFAHRQLPKPLLVGFLRGESRY